MKKSQQSHQLGKPQRGGIGTYEKVSLSVQNLHSVQNYLHV